MKNQRNGFRILILLLICCLPSLTQAQQIFEFYTGVRQNGMGGAYTAVVNDETAVLVNPAGLGKIRDSTITLFDPELSASAAALKIYNIGNYSDAFKTQGLLTELNRPEHYGKPIHMKAQFFPSVILENFGFGLLAKAQTDAMVDSTGSQYTLNFTKDFALALGYNFRLMGGIIKFGVGAKLIDRTEISDTFATTRTDLSIETVGSEGMGVSATTGIILTAPVALLPALAVVVQDVGGTSFSLSDGLFHQVGDRRPNSVSQKIDAGLSISPILGNHVRSTLTVELHDVTRTSEQKDVMRLFHGGGEINFADFFFLRAGLNQGYWTAGAEFATEQFQLQAATYGEEVGTHPIKKEDRRWVGKFSIRF